MPGHLHLAAILLATLLVSSASVHARPEQAPSPSALVSRVSAKEGSRRGEPRDVTGWLILPVADTSDRAQDAQALAKRVEKSLTTAGLRVISAEEARHRFEAVHSTEPVVLPPDALHALREQVQQATRFLALHRLKDALSATENLRQLGDRAQDYLRRELRQAQELFDVCVVTASQIAQGGAQLEAYRHMLRCAQTFPGLKPQPEFHSPDVRELYDTALENIEDAEAADLLIRNTDRGNCTTRVNGISWGPAPALIKAPLAQVRIQLECGAEPGRVHTVSLRPGHNEVSIDPVFDAAIRSEPPRLTLLYRSAADLLKRHARDIATIAGFVGASRVVEVELAQGATLRVMDARGHVLRELRWKGPLDDARELDRVTEALLAADSDGPSVSASLGDSRGYRPALPVLDLPASAAWLTPTTVAIGYAAGIGATVISLSSRADQRQEALSGDFPLDDYNRAGTLGLAISGAGSLVATTAELVGLPEQDSVPWWAWTAGGAGVAVAATGAYALIAIDACDIGDDRVACTTWQRDPLFPTLLFFQSVPLLAVPATYWLSSALGSDATVGGRVDRHHAQITVQGTLP